ncbi:hypothetical protein [Candidatus Solirubrobacter pratensis]|uniref:hypothetical protein n=1 Tax=Candidatus Solirubrobacter pratensis TaxID=1298857 RepID=UPI00040117C8|nr:hypothetical protein [Candidatus Solirubrobacter pratensis]
MPELLLHGRPVRTVFDLLGEKENDLTYALGWGLANAPRLVSAILDEVAAELGLDKVGGHVDIRLQEHVTGSGYTDVEIRTSAVHVIIEAKRGWEIPTKTQLEKYAPSLTPGLAGALLIVAEGSPAFAAGKHPAAVAGADGALVPVLYRSWEQLTRITVAISGGASNQARLLRELGRYLRGLVNMQDQQNNMVYVVALGSDDPPGWSPISPRAIVREHNRYFHPVGGTGGGWPREPPNYLGFRFDGRLQQIRHVDAVEVTQRPRDFIPGFTAAYDFENPHYLYTLGPPIIPPHTVKNGPKIRQSARVWAAIDLLLTCKTITEARDRTNERVDDAGA